MEKSSILESVKQNFKEALVQARNFDCMPSPKETPWNYRPPRLNQNEVMLSPRELDQFAAFMMSPRDLMSARDLMSQRDHILSSRSNGGAGFFLMSARDDVAPLTSVRGDVPFS